MSTLNFRRVLALLAPRPEIPPRLWLTGAAIGLVILNLIFNKELWPYHQHATSWGLLLLDGLLLAAGGQIIAVLWQWPAVYTGPTWMRLLIRGVSVIVSIGIAILMVPLLVAGVVACPHVLRQ